VRPDAVSNLQWQTIADAKAKGRRELRVCGHQDTACAAPSYHHVLPPGGLHGRMHILLIRIAWHERPSILGADDWRLIGRILAVLCISWGNVGMPSASLHCELAELAELCGRARRAIDQSRSLAADRDFIIRWYGTRPSPSAKPTCETLGD
jgi:hypothetical protein